MTLEASSGEVVAREPDASAAAPASASEPAWVRSSVELRMVGAPAPPHVRVLSEVPAADGSLMTGDEPDLIDGWCGALGDFSLDHLPYGAVRLPEGGTALATQLGETVVPLRDLMLPDVPEDVRMAANLDPLLALPPAAWPGVREALRHALRVGVPDGAGLPAADAELVLPFTVSDFVDFYASEHHVRRVSMKFRGTDELPPNWKRMPLGYHGRASSVVVSGTPIHRPSGHLPDGTFGPTRELDFELELGVVTGGPPVRGPLTCAQAAERIFGMVLLNDWSARDIQRAECVPLGPFLGKSFATTISAWVTPVAALEGRRVRGQRQDPEPAAHLRHGEPWHFDLELEAEVDGEVVCRTGAESLYWSVVQMVVHATSSASSSAGDVFGTGTISGLSPASSACLLELEA